MQKNALYLLLAVAVGVGAAGGFAYAPQRAAAAFAALPQPPATRAGPAKPALIRAEGRVVTYPGAEVTVSSELPGTLTRYRCTEKSAVRKGEVIAELRADDTRAAIAEARARVAETEADIHLAELEVRRANDLWARHFLSRQSVDRAQQSLETAQARRENAQATVRRLQAGLEKTVVTAPIAGTVTARLANAGETVDAGKALCTIANLDRLRIEAEVDEFDAGRIRQDAEVMITAEGHAGAIWRGRVEEIPDTVTTRRLKPQDPSRPSDVRILPVKVTLPAATPLKLSQRVEVSIAAASRLAYDANSLQQQARAN